MTAEEKFDNYRSEIVKLALSKAKDAELKKKHPFMHIFMNGNTKDMF